MCSINKTVNQINLVLLITCSTNNGEIGYGGKAYLLFSYFMPVCSIVKTITPRCRGRPDALLHEAEGRVQ